MKYLKHTLVATQVLAYSFVCLWIYATHRYDGFNVGGQKGNVRLWELMLSISFYGGLLTWFFSIAIAGIYLQQIRSVGARIFWLVLSCLGVPIVAFFG